MNLLIALVLNALALIITASIVPGFKIEGFTTAILAAIILGVINTLLKPLLSFLTAPLHMVTFGLFAFVINAVILYIASLIVPGFEVEGAGPAIIGAIVLAVVATILSTLVKEVRKLKK